MTEVDILLDKLMNHFKVGTLQELADKLGIARNTISGWKSRNSLSSVKRKIFELDLPIEIGQYVDTVHGGVGIVTGNMTNANKLSSLPESMSKFYELATNLNQIDLAEECIEECTQRILKASIK